MKYLFSILVLLLAATVANAQTYDSLTGDANLVMHLKLQDNDASTTVVNEVGTDAALANAGNTNAISEVAGPTSWLPRALHLDGTDDHIVPDANTAIDVGSTISVWAKRDVTNVRHTLVGGSNATYIRFDSNDTNFEFRPNFLDDQIHGVATDEWHHYAFVWRADNLWDIIIDGTEVETDFGTGSTSTFDMRYVGAYDTSIFSVMDGYMAEVMIFDRELSLAEVQALYDGPSSGNLLLQLQHGQ